MNAAMVSASSAASGSRSSGMVGAALLDLIGEVSLVVVMVPPEPCLKSRLRTSDMEDGTIRRFRHDTKLGGFHLDEN